MRAGWRKNIASMKGRGDTGADHSCGISNLMRLYNAIARLNQGEQPLSGRTKN
jgi:hypothetical protein